MRLAFRYLIVHRYKYYLILKRRLLVEGNGNFENDTQKEFNRALNLARLIELNKALALAGVKIHDQRNSRMNILCGKVELWRMFYL